MPSPSWPVASHTRDSPPTGPISGNLSGVAARWPVQMRIANRSVIAGRYNDRSLDHLIHQPHFDIGCFHVELPRRTDQHLAGLSRLNVKGDRFTVRGMALFK